MGSHTSTSLLPIDVLSMGHKSQLHIQAPPLLLPLPFRITKCFAWYCCSLWRSYQNPPSMVTVFTSPISPHPPRAKAMEISFNGGFVLLLWYVWRHLIFIHQLPSGTDIYSPSFIAPWILRNLEPCGVPP